MMDLPTLHDRINGALRAKGYEVQGTEALSPEGVCGARFWRRRGDVVETFHWLMPSLEEFLEKVRDLPPADYDGTHWPAY